MLKQITFLYAAQFPSGSRGKEPFFSCVHGRGRASTHKDRAALSETCQGQGSRGDEFDAGMVNLLRALGQVIYSLDAELFASCILGTADCHCLVSEVMLKGHGPSERCKIRSSHQPHDLLFYLIKLIK